MNDIERLRRDVSIVETARSFGINLTRSGNEWEACCPIHAEDTASFTIFQGKDGIGRFQCFGCGEMGDVVDLVEKVKGVRTREAIEILGGDRIMPNVKPRYIPEARDVYAGIEIVETERTITAGQPVDLYNPKTEKNWRIVPSMAFRYPNGGYVLRHDLRDGGKETPMVMWCRLPNGKETWCRFPFPKPRPLYGIDEIPEGAQVVIVEGEKCRDKLRQLTGRNVATWVGGTNGVQHADWSPLFGRSVVIWPDADKPGYKTANTIAAHLHANGCTVRISKRKGIHANV